ncbi:hypothetical protein KUCAC02_003238 [Chaenocephalus aceratus]|uniref:Uncharacterized protein n=1 Tax=Chaenocephalus aceratus TaxID=36190 RepID=A0ACB9WLR7_CHAAC|nr:hypothetical protein KUCAC02_003238 [Chaenocephalus aceratus]
MIPERPSTTADRSQLSPRPCEYSKDLHALHPPTTPAPPTSREDEELPSPTSTEDVVTFSSSSVLVGSGSSSHTQEAFTTSTSVLRKQEGNMTLNDILN